MGRVASILAALFALVAVLGRVGATDPFDRSVRRLAARRLPPPVDAAVRASAWPGFPPQSRIIPPAVAAGAGVALGPRAGLWQLAAWGVVPAASLAKRLIERPRPMPARLRLTGRPVHGSSLPSDHVATYLSVYGFAWWLASGRDVRIAWLGAATVLPVVVLVGPSRVRMDEHWATDTAAGYLFGAAFLAALVALARHDATLRDERAGSTGVAEVANASASAGAVGPTSPARVAPVRRRRTTAMDVATPSMSTPG